MIRVGIVGVSGYSGLVAVELLLKHPQVRITYVSANNSNGPLYKIWPQLKGKTKLVCKKFEIKKAIDLCDLVFLAVPHTIAMNITPQLLAAKKKVIDISADYRLSDPKMYKLWYGVAHKDKANLSKAVYGMPELYREKIKKSNLIANPGCYPTAALLGLLPIASLRSSLIESIIIDAKSGVSGAGRKVATGTLFAEISENFKAYKVLKHQHTPEIHQVLSKLSKRNIPLTFTPHLLPIHQGIFATIYVQLKKNLTEKSVHTAYAKFYKTEKFVRVLDQGQFPEIQNVTGTNYCDIGLAVKDKMLVITSVIDNLVKGASGQAVQNMNIMCGFKEQAALM